MRIRVRPILNRTGSVRDMNGILPALGSAQIKLIDDGDIFGGIPIE